MDINKHINGCGLVCTNHTELMSGVPNSARPSGEMGLVILGV
jgi:hypothetical protein